MATVLLIALPIITIIFLIKYAAAKRRNLGGGRRPPGPRALPLIGNLHQFDSSKLYVCLKQLSDKYGPLMSMRLVNKPVLVISSAELAREALKDNDLAFSSRPQTTPFVRLSYNNLDISTSPYSDSWRDMRKLVVQHLFTRKQIDASLHIVMEEVSRMVDRIASSADYYEPVVINDLAWSYSASVVTRVSFGKRFDETASARKRIEGLLNGLQEIVLTVFAADFFPFLAWLDRLTGKHAHLERICQGLDSFYQELIDEHLSPDRPESMNGDLLDILIKLRDDKGNGSDDAVRFDWGNVKSVLMNIIVAGAGTNSATLTWAMTALIKNPKAMKRAQEEIRSVVGTKGRVEVEDMEKLPYFKAVVKEAFRMYPATPVMVPRETFKKCTVGGYDVEPNTIVYVNVWAICRDPEIWEKPNEFMPERFLDSKIDYKGLHYELLPFGSGRRQCPGIPLAAANVELGLANLLYSFDWEMPNGLSIEDVDVEGRPGIATYKKNPLRLVPKRHYHL